MIPMRTSSIFRSRWMALLWAGGIIWSAVEFASSASQGGNGADGNAVMTDASGVEIDAAQLNQVVSLLGESGR
jgi:membrane protein involved in colicin uptake